MPTPFRLLGNVTLNQGTMSMESEISNITFPASSIVSGTLANARLPADMVVGNTVTAPRFIGDGSGLTNVSVAPAPAYYSFTVSGS